MTLVPYHAILLRRIAFVYLCYTLFSLLSMRISASTYGPQLPSTEAHNSSDFLRRETRNAKPVIYIGVILAQGDEDMEPAFRAGVNAANQVLAQSVNLRAHQLEPIIEVVSRDNVFLATQQACKLMTNGIVALFGPNVRALSQALLSLANRFGIPYIETHWNHYAMPGTYSVSMHPKVQSFGLGLYEYLTQVEKWRRMTIIHSQPEKLLKFTTLVHNFEGTSKVKTWDSTSASAKSMIAELSSSLEKTFLIDIPAWQARDFLVTAFVHNMTGPQFSYFFTDWDVSLLDLTAFKVDGGAQIKTISIMSKAGVKKAMQNPAVYPTGSIPLPIPHVVESNIGPPKLGTPGMLNTQFGILYDSFLLLAHGLITVTRTRPLLPQKLSCERPPGLWPLGLSLINAMKAVSPDVVGGMTGQFRFDREGQRTLFDLTTLELTEGGFAPSGVWNIDERMKVVKKISKRPNKHTSTMNDVVLSVTTKADPPFMISLYTDDYGNPKPNPESWTGYCKELLDALAAEVGFNYTIQIPKDDQYGSAKTLPNGTVVYNGIMGQLIRKEVDMAVAGFTITYEREKLVDFSTPWMTIGGSILFTRPKSQKPSLFSFLQPLAPKVWLYVVAIYLAVCLCMFAAARLSPYEWNAPHPCDEYSDVTKNQFTMLNSFYYYISALLNQGVELAPQATSTRLLTGVWWFFGLIIIATYTANLAAFLTVENTKSPIESVEDLANQEKIKYGTLRSGSSRDFFRTTTIPVFKKMGEFMDKYPDVTSPDTRTGIERVRAGGYAFILESSWNEYYAQRDCSLMQVGALLDSKGYGIGFPQGSVWRDRVSKAILKLQNNQVLANLKRKWWNEFNITEPCSLLKERNKAPSPLGVEQVGGVFIMLLVGFLLGFIVSIVEFVIATRDQKRVTVLKGMWRELKFASRCLTTSKRLKSEIHKLPRSRSNIKLVTSIPANMNVLDNRITMPTTGTMESKVDGQSRDPLLLPQPAHELMEQPAHPRDIPIGFVCASSADHSEFSGDMPAEYPVEPELRRPQRTAVRRLGPQPRGAKPGQNNWANGHELWQFSQPH
uniref:Glutamate receptor ionotropic 3 n=1 Tax=Cryptocotyle lingua TaxID=66766 RepID=A0A7U0YEJ5_9TREM|nr:glutamate receptor ionotropic 3 [Cryptocotyle lingua]